MTGIKNIDGIKYFNRNEVRQLCRTVRDKAELSLKKNQKTAVKEWMIIDLLTSTGLRVFEAANLRCGDLKIGNNDSRIFVRAGKRGLSAHVIISDKLKRHLKKFLAWKEEHGESIGPDDYLFMGQRGHWTRRAIQELVKKYLKALGLYDKGKSAHALRHSYGVQLYSKKKDLRAVQKQLRHTSIVSTQIYADVTNEDLKEQVNDLWR